MMRNLLLASAGFLALSGAAFAQNSSNTPLSAKASHIDSAGKGGTVAPRLPISHDDTTVDQYLATADKSVRAGRTGAAQEALERAETRLLSRSTAQSEANVPDSGPRVTHIHDALQALGHGDRRAATDAIQAAMHDTGTTPGAGEAMAPAAGETVTPPAGSTGVQPIGSTGAATQPGGAVTTHPAGGSIGSNSQGSAGGP